MPTAPREIVIAVKLPRVQNGQRAHCRACGACEIRTSRLASDRSNVLPLVPGAGMTPEIV
jgi:hypothetical protein